MSASYHSNWHGKYEVWAMATLFALFGVFFAVLAVESGFVGGFVFVLVWAGVASYSFRWLYLRLGSDLVLRDGVLIWSPPSGHAVTKELIQLRRVQPWRRGSVAVLIFTDGSELLVRVHKGFGDFVGLLQQRQPWLQVRLSVYGGIVESVWGPSGYSRTR